jgi:hypothetical protein
VATIDTIGPYGPVAADLSGIDEVMSFKEISVQNITACADSNQEEWFGGGQ